MLQSSTNIPLAVLVGRARQAFTLIELMIVLAVVAGMSVIAWPNLRKNFDQALLNESAQSIQALIRETHFKAAESGQIWVIQLDASDQAIISGPLPQFTAGLDSSRRVEPNADGFPGPADVTQSDRSIQDIRLPLSVKLAGVDQAATRDLLRKRSDDSADLDGIEGAGLQDISRTPTHPRRWWIPILPDGPGRSATIWLRDEITGRSIRVIYTGSTGSIEIKPGKRSVD